jgi:hypothetical protein
MFSTGWKFPERAGSSGSTRLRAAHDAGTIRDAAIAETVTWDRGRPARIRFPLVRRRRRRANAPLPQKLTQTGKSKAKCKRDGWQTTLHLSRPCVK